MGLSLKDILVVLKYNIDKGSLTEREISKDYLSILYRMIGQTRDIIDGKGEYNLTYMMIHTWYDFYPEQSDFVYVDERIMEEVEEQEEEKKNRFQKIAENGLTE